MAVPRPPTPWAGSLRGAGEPLGPAAPPEAALGGGGVGVPGPPLGAPRGCVGGWEGAAGGPRGAGRGAGPPALFSAGRAPCVREGGFVVFLFIF